MKMTCMLIAVCALTSMPLFAGAKARKPNIVMILADDQGWGDLSANGNSNLHTPNIDSLAHDGATLQNFYVCPVCSPTRAEMLTGRYHTRLGVTRTSRGEERLNKDEHTIAETFRNADYATGAFGKWHSGQQWPYHPNARGFDEFYGFCSGHWGNYFSPPLERNGRLTKGEGYISDDFTENAIEFIENNRERPFFCYLAFNTPHSPMQVPTRFWKKFEDADLKMRNRNPKREKLQHTRAALAMCENIDWNVGRLLAELERLGISENTVVIYFSDNGPNGWRWNGGMQGKKGSTDEGGVRVPMFIRWPQEIPPGRKISQIAGAIDLLPTLTDISEVPIVGDKKLDGVSLKPLLTGTGTNWPKRIYFNAWRGRVSARTQCYRLDHRGRLYDMENDPGQRKDVSKQHPKLTARLKKATADWRKDTAIADIDRPFTVGHADSPITYLPARDGHAHGSIKRSDNSPNCSFFRNWTSTEDSITWDVEVLTAGKYEVSVYYTCEEKDVGTVLELGFASKTATGTITEANDPPLVGAARDRFKRRESYVKDFKPCSLGTIDLPAVTGTLSLRALKIPGDESIDLRYCALRRVKN